jgi:hypothetical protein
MWGGRHCREDEARRLRWCGHVIRRDEGQSVRDIMEKRDHVGRHCREGSKVEIYG